MGMSFGFVQITPAVAQRVREDSELVEQLLHDDPEEQSDDIDKAWHGIHFLLTGQVGDAVGPLGFIMSGGADLSADPDNLPVTRLFDADEVKQSAAALAEVSAGDLHKRFDPVKLNDADIYPDIWDEGEKALDYLVDNFVRLKGVIAKAAEEGSAMLVEMG